MGSSDRLPLVMTSRPAAAGQQEMVQRRVREHEPEIGQPGRHGVHHVTPGAPGGDDDGAPG